MAIFTAIATAISGALFAGSVLATSLISSALAFGAQLAGSYLNRPKKQKYTAVQGEVQFGANVPAGAMFGTGKVVGHRIFYAKWGSGNKINADVFVLANGWNDGLEPYVYFYGEKYDLVTRTIIGNEVAHYGISGFGSAVSIRFYDGRPGQGVDAKLVSDTASLGKNWKSTSVVAGHAYVVVERVYSADLFPKGRPDFEWVLRGLRCYDPRKDSTVAGGSGAQRLATPSTWVFSKNPALQRLNYQLGIKGLISGRTIIGEGKSIGQIDLGSYFVAMNVCDTVREGKKTYESALYVDSSMDHTEILKEFDDAMAGYGLNRRGLSGIIPGAPQIPVLTITADDIPVDRAQQVQRRKSAFDRYNYMSGQFTSIESNWAEESLTPVYVNADVAADGRPRQTANDFLQVTDPDIAQYLLNIRYRQNRRGGTASVPVSRRVGLAVSEGEWVTFQGVTWLVTEWQVDEQFRFTLVLAETSADIYDDGDIEPGPIVIPPAPTINPSLLSTVANFDVEAGLVLGASGSQVPCLRFTWTPPQDPTITAVRFFYTAAGDATIYEDQSVDPEKGSYVTTKNVASGKVYTARATITTVPDRFKTFTAYKTTLTSTGNISVLDGSITAVKIANSAITAEKIMNEAITSLKLADLAVTTTKIALASVTTALIANDAVVASKIVDGAITAAKIQDGAINIAKFATNTRPVEIVSSLPTTGNVEGRVVVFGGEIYRYTGGSFKKTVAAVDIVGDIEATSLADGIVTTSKLADLAITAGKIASGAISATKLADGAVTNSKLGPLAVDASKIASNAITETKISDDAISTPKLQANAVVADKIAANSIGARQLVVADLSNLIPDSELSDIANWTNAGSGTRAFQASQAGTFDGPVFVFGGSATAGAGTTYIAEILSKYFPVNAGQEYAYGGVIDYTTGTTGGLQYSIRWYDITDTWFASSPSIGYDDYPDAAAHFVSAIATAPAGAVKGKFYARRRATANAGSVTGNVYGHSVYVRRANSGELIVDGAITASKILAGSIAADKLVANIIGTKQLVVADFSNIVPDNALLDIANWVGSGSGSWAFSDTGLALSGGRKATAGGTWTTSGSTYAGALFSDYIPVEPDTDYACGIIIDPDGGATGTLRGTVEWYDQTKMSLSIGNVSSEYDVSTSASAVPFSAILKSPTSAAFARYRVRRGSLTSGGTGTGNVQFGSIYIRRASSGELIVDGAITADKVAANAITAGKIAANAVTAGTVAANAITSDKLAANSVIAGKIAAGIITGSEIAAGAIAAKQLLVSDFSNLLIDSELKDSSLWYTAGDAAWTAGWSFGVNDAQGSGVRSIRFSGSFSGITDGSTWYSNDGRMPVEAGRDYAFGGYMDALTGSTGRAAIYVAWYDKDNAYLSGTSALEYDVSATASRLPYSATATAPALATSARLQVRRRTLAGAGSISGTVDFTSLYLRRASSGELIVDGAITAAKILAGTITSTELASNSITSAKIAAGAITSGKITAGTITSLELASGAVTAVKILAGTITGDKIAANTLGANTIAADAITARHLVLTDFSNLVPDGALNDATAWELAGQLATIQNYVAAPYEGSAWRWTGDETAGAGSTYIGGAISKKFPVEGGTEYTYGAVIDFNSGSTGGLTVELRFFDKSGAQLTGMGFVGYTTYPDASPHLVFATRIAPSNAATADVYIRRRSVSNAGSVTGTVYVYNPYCRRKADAELIVDGSITADKIAVNAITADKINVSSLSAISANLGTVNIEDAIIGTLQVGSSNIATGAVAVVEPEFTTGTINATSSATYTDVASVTISHGSGSPKIILNFTCGYGQNTGSSVWRIYNSTNAAVLSGGEQTMAAVQGGFGAMTRQHTPGSSQTSTTYIVQVRKFSSGDDDVAVRNRALIAFALKKAA